MELLKAAAQFTERRGEYQWFSQYYAEHRKHLGVVDSVKQSLMQMYAWSEDEVVANLS